MNRSNVAGALTAASIHSLIGSGWGDSDMKRLVPYGFQCVSRGPQKEKRRARKAQRQARRKNR